MGMDKDTFNPCTKEAWISESEANLVNSANAGRAI